MLTTLAGTGCVQAEKEQLIEQHEAEIRLLERKHAGRHERVQSEHEDELKRMKQHEDDELSRLRRELKSEADARVHSLETKLAEVERQKGMDLFAAREEMVGAIERIKQARLSLFACVRLLARRRGHCSLGRSTRMHYWLTGGNMRRRSSEFVWNVPLPSAGIEMHGKKS
jgi:hypothetical protein